MFFVDDNLIFLKDSAVEFGTFKAISQEYERASGQCINLSRSMWFSPNVPLDVKSCLIDIIQMREVANLGTYLGLPSMFANGKDKDFKFLLDRIWKILQGSKSKLFSRGGKEILIKSIAQAIPTYTMSYFHLPKCIL